MAMSTMKDSERLELLKEIGGTRVYEDKRKESLKVMMDAEAKKAEVGGEEIHMAVIDLPSLPHYSSYRMFFGFVI